MFIQPHTAGFISFRVRVLGYCGWSAWKLFQYPVTNCGAGGIFFKTYPNPVKESLTIDFTTDSKENQKQASLEEVKIEFYNSYQKLVFETTFKEEQKDRKINIDTNKLPNGVYYLKLINKKEVYTERIVIEK
ncbi:T9SS type A sorting domain-containing protein [Bernardetia sp. MNP-M8]|uniref:T9SS type A sorting domain-containing protein n=1 Tax=Bernardetia sp. MNP-M8 TaxID=3127470 RepID=UPI0030D0361A